MLCQNVSKWVLNFGLISENSGDVGILLRIRKYWPGFVSILSHLSHLSLHYGQSTTAGFKLKLLMLYKFISCTEMPPFSEFL